MKQAIQRNLFKDNLIEKAIKIIRENEPEKGYYLAFSGGKDSIVLYDLAKKSGVKFKAVYHNTTIDPPHLRMFIRRNYPDVEWLNPRLDFYALIKKYGFLPTVFQRFCCRILKEEGIKEGVLLLGVRRSESPKRFNYNFVEEGNNGKKVKLVMPLLEWDDNDVWDYIKSNSLKYCELYDMGKKRIGCLFCALEGKEDLEIDKRLYPRMWERFVKHVREVYEMNKNRLKVYEYFESFEEYFDWWMSRKSLYDYLSEVKGVRFCK